MTAARVDVRAWPTRDGHRRPGPDRTRESLAARRSLTVVAAAEHGAAVERLGLAAFRLIDARGRLLEEGLVYDEDLPDRDRMALAQLRRWVRAHPIVTGIGSRPSRLLPLGEFNRDIFMRYGYRGRATIVGVDLGRTVSLLAAHHGNSRRPEWLGGFSFGLAGTGRHVQRRPQDGGGIKWSSAPHQPVVRVKALGSHGARIAFGVCSNYDGQPAGVWDDDRPYEGRFIDVIPAGFALDGLDTADLADHLKAFDLDPVETPVAVQVNGIGAAMVSQACEAVQQLALALDDEASRYAGGLDLRFLYSPGTVASTLMRRMGVTPPLNQFDTPDDDALEPWANAFHGGWVTAEMPPVPFPAVDIDLNSGYPVAAHLLGWWDSWCAEEILEEDATDELQRFLDDPDLGTRLEDPVVWRHWGFTLGEAVIDGHRFPVAVQRDPTRSGRLEVAPIHTDEPLPFTWCDLAAATLRDSLPIKVVHATRLTPVGRQRPLRPVTSRDGIVLNPGDDPALSMVATRRDAKARGDDRFAAQLRLVANAMVFGHPARTDPTIFTDNGRVTTGEAPGAWAWPPLASCVTAASRLLLTMAETRLDELGGQVAGRDTDGLLIVAAPEPTTVSLGDGTTVTAVGWAELDDILHRFDRLAPLGGSLWSIDRGTASRPLQAVVFGRKRYVLFTTSPTGSPTGAIAVFKHTEHSLGGVYADPPNLAGRDPNGRHAWTAEVSARLVERELGRASGDPSRLVDEFTWDEPASAPFPAVRRLQVASPAILAALPARLGLQPFSPYLQASARPPHSAVLVAADWGHNLTDWATLRWYDTATGEPVTVDTDETNLGAVQLETLRSRAVTWARSPLPPTGGLTSPDRVDIDTSLLRRVGRSGAFRDGLPAHIYRDVDPAGIVARAATALGATRLVELTGIARRTAHAVAAGRTPGPSTIRDVVAQVAAQHPEADPLVTLIELAAQASPARCGLPDCDQPVPRTGARWCSSAHRVAGRRLNPPANPTEPQS